MERLIMLVAITVGSSLGWWAGSQIGLMTAFFASLAGSVAGICGWVFVKNRYIG